MKSILERALVHLLNEENDKAEELLHQFVIETARNIHETLREGDEDLHDDLSEDFFKEGDLDDDDAEADLNNDLGEPEEAEANDMADDTLDADLAVDDADLATDDADLAVDDAEEGHGDIEAEMDDFEAQLAELQAKFDAMLAEIEGEDQVVDDDQVDAEDDLEAAHDDVDAAEGDMRAAEDDEEDFDDITESVVDELQKVAAETEEGVTTAGDHVLGNHQSLKFNRTPAKPNVSTDRVGHKGFARETPPASVPMKGSKTVVDTSMKNVRHHAKDDTHDARNEGPKAILRKTPLGDDKSPISGKPLKRK